MTRPEPPAEPGHRAVRADRDARADPDPAEPDFAGEHGSASFADEVEGGPEQASEPESPEGLSGMDP